MRISSLATLDSRLVCLLTGLTLLHGCASGGGTGGDGGRGAGAAGSAATGAGGAGGSGSGGSGAGGSTGTGGAAAGGSGGSGSGGSTGAGGGTAGTGGGRDGGAGGGTTGSGGTTGTGGATGTGGVAGTGGGTGTGGSAGATRWVGTWTGAPQLTETANLPPSALSNTTLRQVVHASLGGSQLRVRFSNEFGNGAVTINGAHVALCKASPVNSTIDTATDKALSFSGMAGATIPQGMAVWSDPVDFNLPNLATLSVTTAFGGVPSDVTGHPGSRTTSYQQAGAGNLAAASMTSAQTADHWYILSGVDVKAPAAAKGLVVLGDSITDGRGSTTNANDRWPDGLAKRVLANAATAQVSVMNQGIGGNNITTGGLGPTALARFSRDVLGQSGVKYVIVFEGVNDLGADVAASAITSAYATMIAQAHAQGLLIYGATITPLGTTYFTAARETARQTVNTYIKGSAFDGYIDLDAAVRQAAAPDKLQAAYDSGDGLHLNPAGYQKLANTVDLTLLTR